MVDAARTEADTDYWAGQLIVFTSGNISGQARLITAFNASTDTITFTPATTQAVSTQTYEIWPRGRVDVHQWQGSVPNVLSSGRVDATVGAMQADVVTASAIALDAIGASELAATAVNEIRDAILSDSTAFAGASIAAIKAKTDNLPEGVKKNTALNNFEFFMADSADHVTGKTGLTVTGTVSIDGAAFTALTNSVTEVANGIYKIDLAAADLNGTFLTLKFTATGADATLISLKTTL
jgi:hypothetical protein